MQYIVSPPQHHLLTNWRHQIEEISSVLVQGAHEIVRLEAGHRGQPTALSQLGEHHHRQPVDVEEGQHRRQCHLWPVDVQRQGGLNLFAVTADVVVGQHNALGQTGGARGEGQEDHVIGGEVLRDLQIFVADVLSAGQFTEIDGTLGQGLARTSPDDGDGQLFADHLAGLAQDGVDGSSSDQELGTAEGQLAGDLVCNRNDGTW